MSIKLSLRKILSKCLGCKENQGIKDAMEAKLIRIKKAFSKNKVGIADISAAFKELRFQDNDNLMVHCSWRNMYQFIGKPYDVINILLNDIIPKGTLAMPCYVQNIKVVDIDKDPSAAGVLSEVFRTQYNVKRSKGNHWQVAAIGNNADYIVNDHIKSVYGFDKNSPYYKFAMLKNSYIVLMGMGKESVQLSLYHLVESILKNEVSFFGDILTEHYECTVTYQENGGVVTRKYKCIDRVPTKPNKKNIKKIYKQEFIESVRVGNIDIVKVDATRCLDYCIKEARKNRFMIKRQ